jgi:hypothetical protein
VVDRGKVDARDEMEAGLEVKSDRPFFGRRLRTGMGGGNSSVL